MQTLEFTLNLPPDEVEKIYRGAEMVHTTSVEGLRVAFPAAHLRPFVGHLGVQGRFQLTHNQGKFLRLVKLG